MKKFENLGKKLSRDEQKKIRGADMPPEGGQCYDCYGGPGMSSCWYSTSTCQDVCSRVYPNYPNPCLGPSGCGGCHMN
jgi:hypothetical protein